MGQGVRYAMPDAHHPLGTDRLGRDVWARLAHGGRVSLALCVMSVGLAMSLGIVIGAAAGIAGARTDDAIMRVVDGMLSFPRILLLLTVAAIAPPGALTLGVALAATGWMGMARIVRAEIRRIREREFVEAAIASGVGRMGLVWRHLLPNTMGPVLVAATLNAGTVILLESSLSFSRTGRAAARTELGRDGFRRARRTQHRVVGERGACNRHHHGGDGIQSGRATDCVTRSARARHLRPRDNEGTGCRWTSSRRTIRA
jgi:peptide/nickel transport system permease protein